MTNKKRIHNPEPVNKEFKMDMKLTAEEYNIVMMYRSHRLHFEILPQNIDKNVDTVVQEVVEPQVEVTEVKAVVEAQVEPVPEVVEAQESY